MASKQFDSLISAFKPFTDIVKANVQIAQNFKQAATHKLSDLGVVDKPKRVPSKGTSNDVTKTLDRSTDIAVVNDKPARPRPPAEFSKDQAAAEEQLLSQAVTNPTAPSALAGLRVGPELSIEYEANQTTQVELSNPLLRSLSPFMIRIEPPLVYGEQGGFKNRKTGSVATDFGVMSGTSMTGYDRARRALAQSGISGLAYKVGSAEEIVVRNGSGPLKKNNATGQKTDSQGNTEGHLGQPAIADLYTAMDIATQLKAALATPPLVLLINPSTLAIAHNKIQQFQERSRHGYIFQAWGEEQPKLSITARCGAFASGGRGVQFASKRDSLAWQNLMNAFHFYRNNGYIYDSVGKSNANLLVGSLSIHYDGWIYFGHMESFTYTYDEEHMNGGIEFSIEFVASAIMDTAEQKFAVTPLKSPVPSLSDPRYSGMASKAQNTAGEFSVSSDGLTTQGRVVGAGDAFGTLVPQNAVQVFDPTFQTPQASSAGTVKGIPTQPTGKGGFRPAPPAPTPGQRVVSIQTPNQVELFRNR